MQRTLDYHTIYHRNLPHIQPAGATLFVTYRLANSLPAVVGQRLREEAEAAEQLLERLPEEERREELYRAQEWAFGRLDAALDRAESGPKWLGEPAVAQLVCDVLRQADGALYDLIAFAIMPNHVHAVFTPCVGPDGVVALPRIMHALKRPTAWDANSILGRFGTFWQDESYDHYVRDGEELARIVYYVLWNPVKAGLVAEWDAWPWSYWKYA